MNRRRRLAVASALFVAALAIAGCGLGAGADVGGVSLTVTRDFGAEPLLPRVEEPAVESDTVIRVLDRNAVITTRYGGAFVQSIEGVEGTQADGRPYDWFFYVNGLWSSVGAADYPLRGGEAIWWDYRNWSAAIRASALVGSWPQPFADGYEGRRHATAVDCRADAAVCASVRRRLEKAGATLVAPDSDGAIRVLVGPWVRLRGDRDAATLAVGPQSSGIYADFIAAGRGYRLRGLDEDGDPARGFGPGAGLVAATRRFDAPPVWLVTGATPAGVRAAAGLLDAAHLRDHYAVATEAGQEIPLPLEAR